jgi:hypothetical protein
MHQRMLEILPTINLVCTRCLDGNHIALQRWYADHVHLLLAAPELQQAQLFRFAQPLAGQPPDYFCMYEFASMAAFEAFEHGAPKAQATALTNAAAGRSSIEIVQRTQYARWLHRSWPAPAHEWGATWRLAACLQSDAAWSLDAQRWMADQLQALRSCAPLIAAQAYSGYGQAEQCFIALDFAAGEAQAIWLMLQALLAQPALYGQAPAVQTLWAASASPVQAWLR